MTFLTVLLALFIERVLHQHRPQRQHRWFDAYCRGLTRLPLAQRLVGRPWGGALALLPLLVLVAWLQLLFDGLGGLFALVFGITVLLYSLGPRDLGDQAEAFIAARDGGDEALASELAQALCLTPAPAHEPARSFAVARAVVVQAARRLTGPIFWFVLFGAVGAAAYRAVQLLAAHGGGEACPAVLREQGQAMRHLADWAPARLTAASYAIAGNFNAVAATWRGFGQAGSAGAPDENEALLAHTGLAALGTLPEDADPLCGGALALEGALPPPVVEDALALVWRSLAAWLALIAGGSLVAALA